jgi:hypothetical protein
MSNFPAEFLIGTSLVFINLLDRQHSTTKTTRNIVTCISD